MRSFVKCLACYGLSLPFFLKMRQLYLGDVPWNYWPLSFTWESLWCLMFLGLTFMARKMPRRVLYGVFYLAACMLILNDACYAHFGVFWKQGHLTMGSPAEIWQAFLTFLTPELLEYLLLLQGMCLLSHGLAYGLCKKVGITKRQLLFVAAGYVVAVFPFASHRFEEQAMSLVVSVASFLEKPPVIAAADAEELLNPADPDFGLKVPVALPGLPEGKRYNLIVYPMESVRASASSSYGCSVLTTPFLDSMRDRGIFFERCYSNAVRSIKALTTMLLGIYPYHSRSAWSPRPIEKALGDRHLAGILRRHQYFSSFYVNSHISFDGREAFLNRLGFDRYEGSDIFISGDDSILVDRLDGFFKMADAQNKPLLSFLLPSSGHAPYPVNLDAISFPMAKKEANRVHAKDPTQLHKYLNAVHHQDQVAAKIYQYLAETGRLQNTIFVVLGDHGESFGEHRALGGMGLHGTSLFEESVHVPAWIHHPDLEPRTIRKPVQFLDMVPTWLAMMGLGKEDRFPGRNVLVEHRENLFFMNHSKRHVAGVLADRYKLIAYEPPGDPRRFFQLFDLEKDPWEQDPRGSDHPAFAMLLASLEKADQYFPAVQEQFKNLIREPQTPATHGLPPWSKLLQGEWANLPKGEGVIPHLPKESTPFRLYLQVNRKNSWPATLEVAYRDQAGRVVHEEQHRWMFRDESRLELMRPTANASYATLEFSTNLEAKAYLETAYAQIEVPLLKHFAPRTVLFGRVSGAEACALTIINTTETEQHVSFALLLDGRTHVTERRFLGPGEKLMEELPFEDGNEAKLLIEGNPGVLAWMLRWKPGLAEFR